MENSARINVVRVKVKSILGPILNLGADHASPNQ
jgi:hypothetical protein